MALPSPTQHLSLAAASGLSALTFLAIAAASIMWVLVAVSGIDG
ncbi:hypothetical protein ABT008_22725 [Micromonospora sp. NPDC002389]